MDFDLTSEQELLLSAIDPLLAQHSRLPDPGPPEYFVYGDALDRDLQTAGYYGDVDGWSIGRADAALLLERIAQAPFAVPAMASLMVAPAICKLPPVHPIALISSNTDVPVRFLTHARTALIDLGDRIVSLELQATDIEAVSTIFAFPFAKLRSFDHSRAHMIEGASPETFRDAWRLGLTYEMLGAMRAAHTLTLDYVKQRVQFKRLIGSFQAVQHRLAEDAVNISSIHYLAARAAWSGDPSDIAIAAAHAQRTAAQLIYDCHQFHGAMGLTLEYVLHHWTYRLKVLLGELGGAAAQGLRAAQLLWSEAAAAV